MTSALRILHLEDDPLDTELAGELLREGGLDVELERVDTLAEAQRLLASGFFSLVLCDYTVPGVDAFEVLRFVRERYPLIPFVFLSGTLGEDVAIKSLKEGATDYVLKHNLSRLVPAVRRALDEARLQSERRRAEEQLRLLSVAVEAAVNSIVITDREGIILFVNRAFMELTGYSLEELAGKTPRILKSGHHAEEFYHRMWDTLLKGDPWHGQIINRRKNGSFYNEEMTITPVRASGGGITHFIAVKENITERLQVEEAIRRSEAQFRQLADSMPQIVWAARPDGTLDYYNRRWYELTGAEAGLSGDDSWLPVLHPDDRRPCLDLWYESVRTGRPYEIEYRLRFRGTNEYRWHLGRALPVRDEEGEITRWYGTSTDINERKQMREALRETKERLQLALEAARMGSWYWDFESDTLQGDERVRTLVGLRGDEPLSFPKLLERTHANDRHMVAEQALMLKSACGDYDAEFRVALPSGGFRWVLVRGRSSDHSEGPPIHAMGIIMDIGERKKLERDLRAALTSAERAKAAAETANQAKDHFLAVLSHELRTPLAPVLTAVQLLQRRKDQMPEVKNYLEVIRRNVELEARLIDDLLDLTRIVRGKIILERKPLDVRAVIERVLDVCRPDIEARKLDFAVAITGKEIPSVSADPSRLQQVLWNLLKNAIKFTPDGGAISISCWGAQRSQVQIEVRDTGIGIEPEALGRIFNAFEQEDRAITRQFGGLGLGLAISKRLIEMHGGTITVNSAGKGRGTTFTVSLPAISVAAQSLARSEGEGSAPSAARRILLVEDHGDTATMMQRLLEDSGYRVATAGDAKQALELAESEEFDLLVSDLGLPDQSGLELMRELRKRGSTVKGVALSGYGREEDVRRSKEAGFAEHLTKPADFDSLRAVVERLAAG